jgi:hypothetical protein
MACQRGLAALIPASMPYTSIGLQRKAESRDPLKKNRDKAQAMVVARVVRDYLNLRFDRSFFLQPHNFQIFGNLSGQPPSKGYLITPPPVGAGTEESLC